MIKKEILGFDLAKILMAILIVAAHTQFLIEWPSARKILSFIGAAGVPMFFAISAYLFVSKLDNTTEIGGDKQILFHSLKRLAILFAIWYVLMLPMTYERFFTKVTMKETLYAILFTCTFNGYWFIKALIFNTIIIYCCRRTRWMIAAFVVSVIVFVFFSYNYIYHYWNTFTISPYYSFYYHTCMFCIGALYARFESRIHLDTLNTIPLLVIWVLLLCLMPFEWDAPIFRFGTVSLLFPVFYQMSLPKVSSSFWKNIRTSSVIIYMVQFVLIWLYDMSCNRWLQDNTLDAMQHSVVRFAIILAASWGVAYAIIRLERRPRLSFLKYLH